MRESTALRVVSDPACHDDSPGDASEEFAPDGRRVAELGDARTLNAVRDDSVAELHWNAEGMMFAGRVLQPLRWFGLLEYYGPPERAEVGWRKTALFVRFLSFDVQLARERGTGH